MSHDINKPKIVNAGAVFMLNLNNLSIFAFLVFLLSACNPAHQETKGHTHLINSNYGHLKTVNESHLTPAFLINHDPSNSYDVCLSENMKNNFPGIEEEIKASINIWGYYIGRKIDVNIITRKLPVPDSSWSLENRHQVFKQKCPKGVELIVGEDVEKNGSIAYTHIDSRPWYDGQKWVAKSFTRILMLRTITPDGYRNQKFFSLSQMTGESHSEDDILNVLKRRNTKLFSPIHGKVPVMITMLHEIGHVWGLCDMYHLDRGSNCDPNHSEHRGIKGVAVEQESVMYSSKSIVPFYLRDDDLNGIRALDKRFNNNPKVKYTNIEIPTDVPQEKNAFWSELVSVNSALMNDTHIEVFLNLETNGDKELALQYKYSEGANWQTTERYSFFDQARFANYLFKFRNRSYIKSANEIRVVLLSRNSENEEVELVKINSNKELTIIEQKFAESFTSKALVQLNKSQENGSTETLPDPDKNEDAGVEEVDPNQETPVLPPLILNDDENEDENDPTEETSKIEITILDSENEDGKEPSDEADKPQEKEEVENEEDNKVQKRITLEDIIIPSPSGTPNEETEPGETKKTPAPATGPNPESKPSVSGNTEPPKIETTPKVDDENENSEKDSSADSENNGVDLIKFLESLRK